MDEPVRDNGVFVGFVDGPSKLMQEPRVTGQPFSDTPRNFKLNGGNVQSGSLVAQSVNATAPVGSVIWIRVESNNRSVI